MMRTVVNDAWLLMMVLMMLTGRDDTVSGNGDAYGCYVERRMIVRLKTKHSEFDRGSIPSQTSTHGRIGIGKGFRMPIEEVLVVRLRWQV